MFSGVAHQCCDPHQRAAPSAHVQVKLRLIGDGEVRLAGGDQLRRVVGIGRRDQLDIQPRIREVAPLQRDEEGRVVGIDEPVEHQGHLLGGAGGFGGEQGRCEANGDRKQQCLGHEPHLSFSLSANYVSGCQ